MKVRLLSCAVAAAAAVGVVLGQPTEAKAVDFSCSTAKLIVPWGAGGGGLRAEDSRSLVSDNVFENNETREGEHGGGLFLHNFDGRLVNNVIRNNRHVGGMPARLQNQAGARAENNTGYLD